MGTIKCGFWRMDFILDPDEFRVLMEFCKELNVVSNKINIYEEYGAFYNELVSTTLPVIFFKDGNTKSIQLKGFICRLIVENGNAIGFGINPANMVAWPSYKESVRIHHFAVSIHLPKSVDVDKEDKKGKYFIYENIQLHSPQSYTIYQKIIAYIKNITKPLHFKTYVVNEVEEIKSPIRISKKVAFDLEKSWIFNHFEFKITSFR